MRGPQPENVPVVEKNGGVACEAHLAEVSGWGSGLIGSGFTPKKHEESGRGKCDTDFWSIVIVTILVVGIIAIIMGSSSSIINHRVNQLHNNTLVESHNPSINHNQSIVHSPINQSRTINQEQSINQSINQSIIQSTNQPIIVFIIMKVIITVIGLCIVSASIPSTVGTAQH
eukprot:652845-Rhodomonas_salina.1